MPTTDTQYIYARGARFYVRLPDLPGFKSWIGTFDTPEEARQARDQAMAARPGWNTEEDFGEEEGEHGIDYNTIVFPDNPPRQFNRPLTIPNANILVLGDMHVPHHNRTMLRRAVYMTKRYFPQVTTLAIIGDTWDWTSLSRYPKDQPYEDIDASLELGGAILRYLCDHYDDTYIMNGNHDARIGVKLDAPFTLRRVIAAALGEVWPKHCKLHITNLDYVYTSGPEQRHKWVLGHPSHYSGVGGKTPSEIADVELRNVATGHNHRIGIQPSKSGMYLGVDTGHMTDPAFHYYVQRRLTKYPRWTGGFLIIADGYPHLYSDQWTDWERLGCA